MASLDRIVLEPPNIQHTQYTVAIRDGSEHLMCIASLWA
jgi:hypothetical protein